MTPARHAELAGNLAAIRARVAAACAAAGRDVSEITLIAVTKTRPAEDVVALASLGQTDFGENRDQEASPKAAAVAEATSDPVRWHFIGQLQTNKAHRVVRYASVVHSVDRVRLVRALGSAAVAAAAAPAAVPAAVPLTCLVQVSLDGDAARGGALISQLPEIAAAIEAEPGPRPRRRDGGRPARRRPGDGVRLAPPRSRIRSARSTRPRPSSRPG